MTSNSTTKGRKFGKSSLSESFVILQKIILSLLSNTIQIIELLPLYKYVGTVTNSTTNIPPNAKKLLTFVIILIAFFAGFVLSQSMVHFQYRPSKIECNHNSTPSPLPLPLLPEFLPSKIQHFTKAQVLTTSDVFAQPMEHFPNFTEMHKLFAKYSPPTNVQKNVKKIDGTTSALDVYLNIVRPAHWKWFEFIGEKGIKKGEGNSATDLMFGQNILFIKAVQDILQYKSHAKICEIGFNMGHSALTWLIADYPLNRTKYLGFSWNHVNHEMCAHELERYLNLKERKGDVFQVIWGDSTLTIPEFTAIEIANNTSEMEKCDIAFVDGGHGGETPWRDVLNMREMMNLQKNYVFVDDTWNGPPLQAWNKSVSLSIITQYLCWDSEVDGRSFCMGKYN